jgi:hypothetical protein
MTEERKRLFFVAMFALVFYLVGASFVQSFVSYPTWKVVGTNEFNAYYRELSSRIIRVMVLPGVLEIVLTIPLLWFRPRDVPRWPVAAALVLNVARFVSTAVIQIQIREQLDGSGSLSLNAINTMIQSDYVTQATSIARALLYLWMMSLLLSRESETRAPISH